MKVNEVLGAQRNHRGGDVGLPKLGPHPGAELLSKCRSFSETSTVTLEVTPQWPPDGKLLTWGSEGTKSQEAASWH